VVRAAAGLADRPPDEARPFGAGRERFLWTFLAAVGTFLAGSVFAIGRGTYELLNEPRAETEYLVPFVGFLLAGQLSGDPLRSSGRAPVRDRRDNRRRDRPGAGRTVV